MTVAGMGLDELLAIMSNFSPPSSDIVELKYGGGQVTLSLARLSKTLNAFGYMSDCVIIDAEPNDACQIRVLKEGSLDIAHFSMAELVTKFPGKSMEELITLVGNLQTADEVASFLEKVCVHRMAIEAGSAYWIPSGSIVAAVCRDNKPVVGVRRALMHSASAASLRSAMHLRGGGEPQQH